MIEIESAEAVLRKLFNAIAKDKGIEGRDAIADEAMKLMASDNSVQKVNELTGCSQISILNLFEKLTRRAE